LLKQILATEFQNFEKGDCDEYFCIQPTNRFISGKNFIDLAFSVLGVGVFNSDGDMWKFHRSMTRPFFSRERISHFELFARHADEAINLMKRRFREGYALDIQDLNSRFTLDSASEFLFGRCVHTLRSGLPYPHNVPSLTSDKIKGISAAEEFSKAFSDAQKVISDRATMSSLWPLAEIFGDRSKESMKVVRAFLDPLIEEALRDKQKKGNAGNVSSNMKNDIKEGETLLDHLVKVTDGKFCIDSYPLKTQPCLL
jgi:cytochrome P450